MEKNNIYDRCRGCAYLAEGKDGGWECHDCDFEQDIKNCSEVPDEECSLMNSSN